MCTHPAFRVQCHAAPPRLVLAHEPRVSYSASQSHVSRPVVTPLTFQILRSQRLKNETLAQISNKYNLSSRLVAHPAQAVMLRRNPFVKAALFEAYIAGVHYSTSPAVSTPSSAPMAPTTDVSHPSILMWLNLHPVLSRAVFRA